MPVREAERIRPRPAVSAVSHSPHLDSLRAIAALSVVLVHVSFYAPVHAAWAQRLLLQSRAGVWIFFVLSGYLLYRPFARAHAERGDSPRVGAYFTRRFLRVYPAYWVALIFFTYVTHQTLLYHSGSARSTFLQFGLLQIYNPTETFQGLAQTWSLAVEITFYLMLPVYAFAIGAAARRWRPFVVEVVGALLLAVAGFAWWVHAAHDWVAQQWLPMFLPVFACGIGLAVAEVHAARDARVGRAWAYAGRHAGSAWLVAVAAVLLASRFTNGVDNHPTVQFFYTLFGLLLVLPAAAIGDGGGRVRAFLRTPALVYVGRISYGLFLWHYLIMFTVRDHWLGGGTSAPTLGVALLTLGPSLAAAAGSWYLIERPALRLATRITRR
ncbi:MAG: acyltransferase 3 [Actinomycetia bacterium]|nr:acyltransferase 3 [Actinomycetes bacterium]